MSLPDQCRSPGNQDLYGLGVRLGVYFQWVTSYLANYWVADEIGPSADGNAMFLFAIAVGVLKNTVDGTLNVLDSVLMLYITWGYLLSVLTVFGYRTRFFSQLHISVMGSFIRLLLTTLVAIYAAWFWFIGLHTVQPYKCEPVMFIFAVVNIHGGIKYFTRVISLLWASYFGILLLIPIVSTLVWIVTLFHALIFRSLGASVDVWKAFWRYTLKSLADDERLQIDLNRESAAYKLLRLANLFIILLFMVAIEVTINLNRLEDVTNSMGLQAVGQVIPTVIGATSLVRILWILFHRWLGLEKEDRKHLLQKKLDKITHPTRNLQQGENAGTLSGAFSSLEYLLPQEGSPSSKEGVSEDVHEAAIAAETPRLEQRHWIYYGYTISYIINCRVLIWILHPKTFVRSWRSNFGNLGWSTRETAPQSA